MLTKTKVKNEVKNMSFIFSLPCICKRNIANQKVGFHSIIVQLKQLKGNDMA
jgi:hypothetical protein